MEIRKASIKDLPTLEKIVVASFLVPHGHAAPKQDIDNYISKHFNTEALRKEILNPYYHFYLLFQNEKMVGFSKLICNYENDAFAAKNIAKMERIYLLKSHYGLGLGKKLFAFNISLAKKFNQTGIWLHVWTENTRAVQFYKKMGMYPVGSYDFKVSETHYNPNHVMYLSF